MHTKAQRGRKKRKNRTMPQPPMVVITCLYLILEGGVGRQKCLKIFLTDKIYKPTESRNSTSKIRHKTFSSRYIIMKLLKASKTEL